MTRRDDPVNIAGSATSAAAEFEPGCHPSPFSPSPWCRGPHLQTMWPYLFRHSTLPVYRRERIELADGDFVDLDWHDVRAQDPHKAAPLVLLFHGLEGCSRSHYIMGMVNALDRAGFASVVMHFRTCSGEPNRKLRSYHAGDTGDMSQVVDHIRNTLKLNIFATIGYSLGGNAMLKWLGDDRPTDAPRTAIAVSVPFSLNDAADRMKMGFSKIYQKRLVSLMHQKTRARLAPDNGVVDLDALEGWQDFRSFDHNITAPLHGFDGVDDYYGASSSLQYLKGIQIPTLLLHAQDDPFMLSSTAPQATDLSPTTRLELSPSGGHVGFVGGLIRPVYWLESRVVAHLQTFSP